MPLCILFGMTTFYLSCASLCVNLLENLQLSNVFLVIAASVRFEPIPAMASLATPFRSTTCKSHEIFFP